MTPEQITTIVTNLLTSGGVAIFFFFVVRSLKREITGLNKTIEQQNKTLDVMEKRVVETEKVGNIYRDLIDDLPEQVSKYKKFINQTKDDVMAELAKAQDETVKESRQLELKRLELQEQMLADLPRLREEMITAIEGIEERISVMYPNVWPSERRIVFRSAAGTLVEVPQWLRQLSAHESSETLSEAPDINISPITLGADTNPEPEDSEHEK